MDWLLTTALAAVVSTLIWYIKSPGEKYRLGLLSLMLWGTTLMIFVDHLVSYILEKGEFLEMTPEAASLGFTLIVSALVIWVIALIFSDPKRSLSRRK